MCEIVTQRVEELKKFIGKQCVYANLNGSRMGRGVIKAVLRITCIAGDCDYDFIMDNGDVKNVQKVYFEEIV